MTRFHSNGLILLVAIFDAGNAASAEIWGQIKLLTKKNIDYRFVLGNSSSGLIEAASFNKFALNIGNRQLGRIRNKNVIDVKFDKQEIIKNCHKVLNNGVYDGDNIYYKEGNIEKVIEKIYEFL